MAAPSVPRCVACGRRINFNPRAQTSWNKAGRTGTVPGAGWHHAEDLYGGEDSFTKDDPNFHYAVVPEGVTPEAEMTRKKAEGDQMRAHIERHLGRQFDFLAAEKRGGTHIDLAED
jgi:hypothetical protein